MSNGEIKMQNVKCKNTEQRLKVLRFDLSF
jgi:hypothetical protein